MILVIDSGGTKLEWRLLKNNGAIEQGRTTGFHPLFHYEKDLVSTAKLIKDELSSTPDQIYYYGAGCSTDDHRTMVKKVLDKILDGAVIEVNSDLVGVARALCGDQPGVACILGTGSNSCQYDGTSIVENIPPLGFILGDEGSGSALGKNLLRSYCRKDLPTEVMIAFEKKYNLKPQDVVQCLYQEKYPNRYLASFAKFMFHHQNSRGIYQIILGTFDEFIVDVLMKYESINQYQIHFSGAIAFYFNSILRQALKAHDLTTGNIVETPIAGLALFHQKDLV